MSIDATLSMHDEVDGPGERPVNDGDETPRDQVEPPVWGESALRWLEKTLLRIDAAVHKVLPEALNPFAQTGAIANTSFVVALVSGILLLFWYSSSVHQAYESVVAMGQAPWTAGLMRSLHRYSSDACMAFALLHALKLFAARRFTGSRWLAWVTGLAALGLLWGVGWLGYWLVWDERARQVAMGTARLLDALPIFADPLSRGFLADSSINSLLFFVVFFLHMLVPLAIGIALWLHIARLARPWFLTRKTMSIWVVASLVLVSLLLPADVAGPARMTVPPQHLAIDGWYLLPVALTDRLSATALWALMLIGGAVGLSMPWWMARGKTRPAQVDVSRCNACTQCFQDCPYNAISMVPRTDGKRFPSQAQVDPSRCVGCGICVGSCSTHGIELPWLPKFNERRRLEKWLEPPADSQPVDSQAAAGEGGQYVAFVCSESAGGALEVDQATGTSPALPGYRISRVPCVGWVHSTTIDRTLKQGAKGVLLVTCDGGNCRFREGPKWASQRLGGERRPALRIDKLESSQLRIVTAERTGLGRLTREATAFRDGQPDSRSITRSQGFRAAVGTGLVALISALIFGGSVMGYATPHSGTPELVVSFKHPGKLEEQCRPVTAEEKAKLPPHMRRDQICERGRAPVRLRVRIDGNEVHAHAYPPGGLWGDGNSVAVTHLEANAGEHRVEVAIGDAADPNAWAFTDERTVNFNTGERRVILFDRLNGFSWH